MSTSSACSSPRRRDSPLTHCTPPRCPATRSGGTLLPCATSERLARARPGTRTGATAERPSAVRRNDRGRPKPPARGCGTRWQSRRGSFLLTLHARRCCPSPTRRPIGCLLYVRIDRLRCALAGGEARRENTPAAANSSTTLLPTGCVRSRSPARTAPTSRRTSTACPTGTRSRPSSASSRSTRDVHTSELAGDPSCYEPAYWRGVRPRGAHPACEFSALAHRHDRDLAAHFGVPVEQIARRRRDLAISSRRHVPRSRGRGYARSDRPTSGRRAGC
jgi:hypothetical protein